MSAINYRILFLTCLCEHYCNLQACVVELQREYWLVNMPPVLWSWDEVLLGTSLLRAINWHRVISSHLEKLCQLWFFWWESHQRPDLAGSDWLANLALCVLSSCSSTQHQPSVQPPLPVARELPLRCFIPWQGGLHHALISFCWKQCDALIFGASHTSGAAVRQSCVIITCFNPRLPNQCLLVLAALYIIIYLANCKQAFLEKIVCSSAQHKHGLAALLYPFCENMETPVWL